MPDILAKGIGVIWTTRVRYVRIFQFSIDYVKGMALKCLHERDAQAQPRRRR
jgi:hypothetical protein